MECPFKEKEHVVCIAEGGWSAHIVENGQHKNIDIKDIMPQPGKIYKIVRMEMVKPFNGIAEGMMCVYLKGFSPHRRFAWTSFRHLRNRPKHTDITQFYKWASPSVPGPTVGVIKRLPVATSFVAPKKLPPPTPKPAEDA